jgi:hypothetical protein
MARNKQYTIKDIDARLPHIDMQLIATLSIAEELRRANEIQIAKMISDNNEDQYAHLKATGVVE